MDLRVSTREACSVIHSVWRLTSSGFSSSFAIPSWPLYCTLDSKGLSMLHSNSCFGIAEVAGISIKVNGWDVNQRDGTGVAPVIWAAR